MRGFDAEVLPAVCEIWLRARKAGALQTKQLDKAQKAELLTRALARVGIIAMVGRPALHPAETQPVRQQPLIDRRAHV